MVNTKLLNLNNLKHPLDFQPHPLTPAGHVKMDKFLNTYFPTTNHGLVLSHTLTTRTICVLNLKLKEKFLNFALKVNKFQHVHMD